MEEYFKRTKKDIVMGSIALAGFMYFASNIVRENSPIEIFEYEDSKLTKQVEVLADKLGDKNGQVSTNEWKRVYDEIGVKYPTNITIPLTILQKQEYIRNNQNKVGKDN